MNITLIQGRNEHIEDCITALTASALGEKYFPSREKACAGIIEFVEHGTLLIARDERKAFIGFLCYLENGAFHAFPYLHILAIAAAERGKGYGNAMMDVFEEMMFRAKDKIFLVVADFNPRVQHFYLQRGYREVGTIPDLYRAGIAEHLMMKIQPDENDGKEQRHLLQ